MRSLVRKSDMTDFDPNEFEPLARRLSEARVEPTALELDELRQKTIRAAREPRRGSLKLSFARNLPIATLLTGGLVAAGTAGVQVSDESSPSFRSANHVYPNPQGKCPSNKDPLPNGTCPH